MQFEALCAVCTVCAAKFALLARDRFSRNRYPLPMRRFLALALGWLALGLCVLSNVPEASARPIASQSSATINPNIGAVVIRSVTTCDPYWCNQFNDTSAKGRTTTTIPLIDTGAFTGRTNTCLIRLCTTTTAPRLDPCNPQNDLPRPASCDVTTTVATVVTTTTKPGPPPPPGVTTTTKPYVPPEGPVLIFDPINVVPVTTIPVVPPPPVVSDNVRIETTGASFGDIGVSAASSPKTITVSNLGTIPVRITGATVPVPFAVVAGGTCATTPQLNPGANCTYQVVFRPGAPGQSISLVSIGILAPAGDLVAKASVDGVGTAARIAFDAPNLDMGQGVVGEATPGTATLRNTGSSPITIKTLGVTLKKKTTEIAINAKSCIGATLAPGAACAVSITFKPTAGVRTFELVASGTKGELARSIIKRQGLRNSFSLSPGLVDFGPQQTAKASAVKKVTVRNTGELPLKFQTPLLQGVNLGDFTIAASSCSANPLAPKATCTIDLSAKPKAFGAKAATLRLASGKLAQVAALRAMVPPPVTVPPVTSAPPATAAPAKPAPTTVAPKPTVLVFDTIPTTVAPTAPPTTLQPILEMNPAVGPTGRVTLALGKGFPANTKVQLKWAGKLRGTWSVTTDAAGKFRLPILVNSGEPIGGRIMTAVDQPGSFTNVGSEFLAQLPTFRPGNGPRNDRLVSRR
jgi:hypothetical protein